MPEEDSARDKGHLVTVGYGGWCMTDDEFYQLGILLDWAVGQGFCQIEGMDDPEELAFRIWDRHDPTGDGYSAQALATLIKDSAGKHGGHMTKGDELLACPFCSSEQVTTAPDRQFGGLTWMAICKGCGASVERDLEEQTITAWNTRSQK